jgi:hypothetical protein
MTPPYPKLMWKRGVVTSALLERSPSDQVLVGEISDFGIDGPDRYRADWLAGGAVDRAAFASLDEAKAWVRARVHERLVRL